MKKLADVLQETDVRELRKMASQFGVQYSRQKRKQELVAEMLECISETTMPLLRKRAVHMLKGDDVSKWTNGFFTLERTSTTTVTILFLGRAIEEVK